MFSADPPSRSERIDIRTTPAVKQMLQAAAAARRKSVTDFMLDLPLAEVAELHSQQRLFSMDDPQWDAFITALASHKAQAQTSGLVASARRV